MTRNMKVSGNEKPGFARLSISAIITVNNRGCKTLKSVHVFFATISMVPESNYIEYLSRKLKDIKKEKR